MAGAIHLAEDPCASIPGDRCVTAFALCIDTLCLCISGVDHMCTSSSIACFSCMSQSQPRNASSSSCHLALVFRFAVEKEGMLVSLLAETFLVARSGQYSGSNIGLPRRCCFGIRHDFKLTTVCHWTRLNTHHMGLCPDHFCFPHWLMLPEDT